MPYIRHVPFFP